MYARENIEMSNVLLVLLSRVRREVISRLRCLFDVLKSNVFFFSRRVDLAAVRRRGKRRR